VESTRQQLGDRAERLVLAALGGVLAPRNNEGWDLHAPGRGRVEVKARSRASKHLNWVHIRNIERQNFDYLVVVEFDPDGSVAGAWGLTAQQVRQFAHSTIPSTRGGSITKLALRGDWKRHAELLALDSAPASP
jgi:hypothetical protein